MTIVRDSGVLVVLAASAARAASGDTGPLDNYDSADSLRVQLDVTALTVGAGNTLDVVVEDTLDGSTWNVIGTFAQKAATGREVINISTPFGDIIRVRWTVGGAAGPTFEVRAFAQ